MANQPDPLKSVAGGLGKAVGSFQKWAKTLEASAGSAASSASASPPPPLRRKVLAPPPPRDPQADTRAPEQAPKLAPTVTSSAEPQAAQRPVPAPPVEWTTSDGSIGGTIESAPAQVESQAPVDRLAAAEDRPSPPAPADPVPQVRAVPDPQPRVEDPPEPPARSRRPAPTQHPVVSVDTRLVTSPGGFVMPPPPRELVIPPLPAWVTVPTERNAASSSN